MKRKITLPVLAVALAVALTAMTSTDSKSEVPLPAADYWIYVPTSTNFKDTSKYQKVFLSSPAAQSCPTGTVRPCVYQEASGSLATKADLYTHLQAQANDAAILANSLRKKDD